MLYHLSHKDRTLIPLKQVHVVNVNLLFVQLGAFADKEFLRNPDPSNHCK